jgi:hypothetical protein
MLAQLSATANLTGPGRRRRYGFPYGETLGSRIESRAGQPDTVGMVEIVTSDRAPLRAVAQQPAALFRAVWAGFNRREACRTNTRIWRLQRS